VEKKGEAIRLRLFRFCDTQVPPSVIETGRRLPGNTLKSRMDKLFTSIPEIA